MHTTPMRGAARCDLFFVRVIRVLDFARPSNALRLTRGGRSPSSRISNFVARPPTGAAAVSRHLVVRDCEAQRAVDQTCQD